MASHINQKSIQSNCLISVLIVMLDNGQAIFRKKHLFFSIDSGFSVSLFMYSYVCKYTVWYLLPHLHIEFFLHVYSAFFFLTVNTTYVVSFSFLRELVKKKKKTSFGMDIISTSQIRILRHKYPIQGASLISQLVKNPPVMQETLIQFLGQEYLLEKG